MVGRADGKHLLLKSVALRQLLEMSCELPVSAVGFSCQNSLLLGCPLSGAQTGKEEERQQAVRCSDHSSAFLFYKRYAKSHQYIIILQMYHF